jgi:hypothetical protein
MYGAYYYKKEGFHEANDNDLYYYKAFLWEKSIIIDKWDSLYHLSNDKKNMFFSQWPKEIPIKNYWVLLRWYSNWEKSSTIDNSNLPYVNGCSTREIFHTERPGDPTAQLLTIPAYSSEQQHHIHSTVRVVYILEWEWYSVVWMKDNNIRTKLEPWMMIVLEKFAPHHFETEWKKLIVLPIHIFSTIWSIEKNHPMFNWTHLV